MKTIKTNQQLVNMKGEPLTNDENKPVFLGVVISNVLGGKTKNPSLGWILGKKFATEKTVDLLAEEVVFLKEEIKELGVRPDGWLSGLLCGQILDILDSKDEKDEKATDTADKKKK